MLQKKTGGATCAGLEGDSAQAPPAGKRTLVEQIGNPAEPQLGASVADATARDAPPATGPASGARGTGASQHQGGLPRLQLKDIPRASPSAGAGSGPEITPPKGGIDKAGFIDHGDGANIRTGPAESGGRTVRDQPLPPATRVFVSGTHPSAPHWWYVTAYLDKTMVRGYVQDFRVTTDLPEPTAELHQVVSGDTAEKLAVKQFGTSVRDGHDLRYYENVLLHVNQQRGRAGVTGSYQDPGVLGGGGNNVQLVADHRIWLVSPAYAKALESVVPDGSLTGGAVAKVKRFVGHLQDILRSVTEARHHFDEVAGEYAQAIRDDLPEIAGIVAGFLLAEATSAFLAATPTGVGQIAAVVIQLGLAAFGAAGIVQAGVEAVKHAGEWLTIAWTAKGNDEKIAAASKEFLKMLVGIAMAALSYGGMKGNYGNAIKIASSMPTGGWPALAVAGGGQLGGAGAGTGVLIGPSTGSIGAGGTMMTKHEGEGDRSETTEAPKGEKPPPRAEAEADFAKHAKNVANEAPGEARRAWEKGLDLGNERARVQAEGEAVYRDTLHEEYLKARETGQIDAKAIRTARDVAQAATKAHVRAEGVKIAEARARADVLKDANGDGIPDAFKSSDARAVQDFGDFSSGARGAMAKNLAAQLPGKTVEEMEALLLKSSDTRHPVALGTFDTVTEGQISYPQISYTFPDSTLIRIKPLGDVRNSVKPMYSVEMQTKPLQASGHPQNNVAFKMDAAGNPVPKGEGDINNPYTPQQPAQRKAYKDEILRLGHQLAKEED